MRKAAKFAIVAGAITVGAVLSAALAAAALTATFARAIVTPPQRRREDLAIIALDEQLGTITLTSTADSRMPGRYSFWFAGDSGHARLGEIIEQDSIQVVRTLLAVDFGDLASANRGRLAGWFYLGPWEFDYAYESIQLETPLGGAPAWLIPADSDRWVIQIHGRAVRRHETLRAIPVFHEAGYNALLISYRNDGEGPQSPDGRYGLGGTEWQDAEAAVRYAAEHGAREIVLMGWSMGGAIALQTALLSEHRELITGVVLDSPAIDWNDIIEYQGAGYRFPPAISAGVVQTLGSEWGRGVTGLGETIDFDRLDMSARAAEITVPVLIQHSDDDGYVPSTGSHALAAARPDIVTAEWWSGARHTKLWNYDSERWNRVIAEWLETHSDKPPVTKNG